MKKILYIILLIIILVACNGPSQTKKTMKTEDKSNSKQLQIDAKTPEYKAFLNQEHRFELNGCELKYNDNPFKLGMTLQEFEDIFGSDYEKRNTLIKWNKKITVVAWFDKNNIISEMRLIYDEDDILISVYDSYINSKLSFEDFLKKSSKLSFEDFFIHDDGYRLSEDECKLLLDFDSPVVFNRIGEGHMTVRGKPKLDETYPIKSISIYYK